MKQIILKTIDLVFKTKFSKEEVPPYPNDFLIIDASPIAKQNGIVDEQNKIIYRYSYNKLGRSIVKKYRYSEARLKALHEIHNLPFIDKTRGEDRFPIHARILPSEITYTTR